MMPSAPRSREHARQTRARAHGDKAKRLFGRGRLRSGGFSGLELLLNGFQIVRRAGLAAFCQIVVLHAHVLDLGKLQRAVFLGFRQGVPRNVRVDVHLERLVVLADDKAVADGVEIHAKRLKRNVLVFLADDVNGIVGKGNVLGRKVCEVCLLLCLAGCGLCGDVVSLKAR